MKSLFRGFWREYSLSWVRLGKDKRALPAFLRGTLILIGVPLWSMLVFGLLLGVGLPPEQRSTQLLFHAIMFCLGCAVALVVRRSNRRSDEFLRTSIIGRPAATSHPPTNAPAVRQFLAERMNIETSFVVRMLSELEQYWHQLPNGSDLRSVLNQLLRQQDLWNRLEPDEAELAALPHGTWPAAHTDRIFERVERLRLLRWVLQYDEELLPLASFPALDAALIKKLEAGFQPAETPVVRESWEIRGERDTAGLYLARALAELDSRHLLPAAQLPEAFADLRASLAGPSTDLLVGTRTIDELSDTELQQFMATAVARLHYADYLIWFLASQQSVSFTRWFELSNENEPGPGVAG